MRFRGYRRPGRHSAGRWIVAALGLGLLVAALVVANGPYRQTREFRRVAACQAGGTECFAGEPGTIRGRDEYTTTDSNSNGSTSTTTHYEVTWEESGGGRQTREVSWDLYRHAEDGAPATLRRWRGEVVALETGGTTEWFVPRAGQMLWLWLILAWFGLGVTLWGLLFGWWDGFFFLGYRTFCWMFVSLVPVAMTVDALAYGLHVGAIFVGELLFGIFATAIGGWMLVSTLKRW
ncbi:hypothetical protein [Dactylosporangium darangshiense]|uniref:DUF3592 domain-containing protein n=1 Tax=Dactylosporangium darangshiense TaxID=579108 RepID=A0ABP8DS57_9ACTN